jgi:hypothetical protein
MTPPESGEWAAEAPQELLAALGARRGPLTGRYLAPHVATTFRRVLQSTDAAAAGTVIGLFLAELAGAASLTGAASALGAADPDQGTGAGAQGSRAHHDHDEQEQAGALSVDGKAVRGARQGDGRAVHLPSAMIHGGRAVVAQRDVAHKTNEIPEVRELLRPLDLRAGR